MNLTRRHLLQAAATAAGACAVPAALASPAHGLSSGTVRGAAAQNPNTAWRMAGHGPARTNATVETVLSPTTVSGLRQTGSFLYGHVQGSGHFTGRFLVDRSRAVLVDTPGPVALAVPGLRRLWRGTLPCAPTVLDSGVLYGIDSNVLYAADAATQRVTWSVQHGLSYLNPELALAGGLLVVSSDATASVVAYDAATGAQRWRTLLSPLPRQFSPLSVPSIWQGSVYVEADLRLNRFDLATGTQLWSVPMADPGRLLPIADGVVLGLSSGYDALTGRRIWQNPPSSSYVRSTAVADGVVYRYAQLDISAFDLHTGALRWVSPAPAPYQNGAGGVVYANGVLYGSVSYLGLENAGLPPQVRAWSALDGHVLWQSPDLTANRQTVNVTVAGGRVYSLDTERRALEFTLA